MLFCMPLVEWLLELLLPSYTLKAVWPVFWHQHGMNSLLFTYSYFSFSDYFLKNLLRLWENASRSAVFWFFKFLTNNHAMISQVSHLSYPFWFIMYFKRSPQLCLHALNALVCYHVAIFVLTSSWMGVPNKVTSQCIFSWNVNRATPNEKKITDLRLI